MGEKSNFFSLGLFTTSGFAISQGNNLHHIKVMNVTTSLIIFIAIIT